MSASVRVLFIGVTPDLQEMVKSSVKSIAVSSIETTDAFFAELEKITDDSFDLIFLGNKIPDVAPMELSQSLRMQAGGAQIHYLAHQGEFQDVAALIKNGCNQAYFMPVDKLSLQKVLRLLESSLTGAAVTAMEAVPLIDLEPGTQVEFEVSVFLPMNNKYVKVLRKGSEVKSQQLQKMEEHSVQRLYIDERDMDQFLSYSTKRLKSLTSGARSSTEQKKKLQSTVRNLFQDLLTGKPTTKFEDGKEYLSSSQKIVADYVGSPKAFNLQKELSKTLCANDGDFYDRSGQVSTIATLFALSLGEGSPESVAIAGLFLDLGLAVLPPSIAEKPTSQMSKEEFEIYAKHPLESVRILQERKMVLAPPILDGISQHHERFDGKGYPKALPFHRISIDAQILYIADHFIDFSRTKPGQKALSPLEIFELIAKDGGANPELLSKLKESLGVK